MCDPVTLTMMAISTAVSASGSIQQGQAQQASANAQAQEYERQGVLIKQKATADIAATERDYQRHTGKSIALEAQSGVDLRSFSEIMNDDRSNNELQKRTIQYSADNHANTLNAEASAKRVEGDSAATAGYINAFGAVVKGASSMYGPQQAGGSEWIASPAPSMGPGVYLENEF